LKQKDLEKKLLNEPQAKAMKAFDEKTRYNNRQYYDHRILFGDMKPDELLAIGFDVEENNA